VADARGRGGGGGGAAGEGTGAREEAPHRREPRHGRQVARGSVRSGSGVVRALVAKGGSRFGGDGGVSDQNCTSFVRFGGGS
jgi:hypothetical protein